MQDDREDRDRDYRDRDLRDRDLRDQWDDLPEHSGSWVDARTGEPYDEETYGQAYRSRSSITPAWHENYDWSDSHDDEESWTPRADQALTEMQTVVSQSERPATERLSKIAGHVVSLSGL